MKKRKRLRLRDEHANHIEAGEQNMRAEEEAERASNDVELGQFEAGLRIDKHRLDDAIEENPEWMQRASSRYAHALSLRDEAKDRVKVIEGSLYTSIKLSYVSNKSGRPPSEATIKSLVDAHPKRQKAVKTYLAAVREAAEWEGMFESYKQRGFALQELVKLFLAGYFANTSGKVAERMRERDEHEARLERHKQARRERKR